MTCLIESELLDGAFAVIAQRDKSQDGVGSPAQLGGELMRCRAPGNGAHAATPSQRLEDSTASIPFGHSVANLTSGIIFVQILPHMSRVGGTYEEVTTDG
ncbi:hypothetical protein GCM10011608_12230 [Micromonospora sonchi]|uniref:Uncharacterized protein n=1 Tax=Micromonospora sonchi TaxID=1763543 RepID=A0A917WTY4_9ACTN|nr:hypothetical protein GCM10011608_12230 [Micromonospora sonchi]